MSYDLYWYGDIWAISAFLEADRLRRERQNYDAWLQGMYIYDALCKVSPVLHAFAKKGTKPQPYPAEPYLTRKEESQADNEQQVKNERLKAQLYFKNWARAVQKKFDSK